jgi:hypothetical protein
MDREKLIIRFAFMMIPIGMLIAWTFGNCG